MLDNLNFETLEVPGRSDIKILITSRSTSDIDYNNSGSKTPSWFIGIKTDKNIMSSSIGEKGYETFSTLYGFHIEASREIVNEIVNPLFTGSMITHEACIVVIPNGGYAAELENIMYSGKVVTKVFLHCLGWFGGVMKPYQKLNFDNCHIIRIDHYLDMLIVTFRVQKKTHTFLPYTQNGTAQGQSVCTVEFATNKSTAA